MKAAFSLELDMDEEMDFHKASSSVCTQGVNHD